MSFAWIINYLINIGFDVFYYRKNWVQKHCNIVFFFSESVVSVLFLVATWFNLLQSGLKGQLQKNVLFNHCGSISFDYREVFWRLMRVHLSLPVSLSERLIFSAGVAGFLINAALIYDGLGYPLGQVDSCCRNHLCKTKFSCLGPRSRARYFSVLVTGWPPAHNYVLEVNLWSS